MSTHGQLGRIRRAVAKHRTDLIATGVLVLVAVAFLSPALKDGPVFGPFDLDLSLTPLTSSLVTHIHSPYNGDAVSQMIAWNTLDWQMIHHGQFPLWNQYSALGMPQFLNFESSVLSLPDLFSYLVPLRFAFLVVVFVKLLLAGLGVYLFARVFQLHPLAAFFAGVTFMLSGAFVNWVTWPLSDVAAWSGWICAFAVLAYRSTRPRRYVCLLGVSVAFSVYGGFPEANVMFAIVLVVLIGVTGCVMLGARRVVNIAGVVRVIAGGVIGGLLSAPLWWPGLQVIALGHRTQEGHYAGLPLRSLPLLFSQGFFGLPIGGSDRYFQLHRWNYYETVTYVGIIAIVLVLVALLVHWRRPLVIGLFVALVASLAITYEPTSFHPLQSLLYRSGELSAIRFERMRIFTGFLVALLAGLGLDALIRQWSKPHVRRSLVAASAASSVVVMLALVAAFQGHLPGVAHAQRTSAMEWPVVLTGCLLVGSIVVMRFTSSFVHRLSLGTLCVGQSAFLFVAGVGIPTYGSTIYPSSPAVAQLQQIVGGTLVGLDGGNATNVRLFTHVGLYPDVNIGYHVRMFGVHDPLVPKAYFSSWPIPSAAPQKFGVGLFVPDIDTVALARRYGIGYVLAAPGVVKPPEMTEVAVIAGEPLYRVPDSTQFSFENGRGVKVISEHSNGNGEFVVQVDAQHSDRLICRVTNLTGWQATIDNHSAPIAVYDNVMMSIAVPPGRHEIVLRYWPKRLSEGIALGIGTAVVIFGYLIGIDQMTRRRLRRVPRRNSESTS